MISYLKYIVFIYLSSFLILKGQPSQWQRLTKNIDYAPTYLSVDSSSNSLLISNGPSNINGIKYSYCALWDGTKFDSLAPYSDNYNILQIIKYKGNFYANAYTKILKKVSTYSWTEIAAIKGGAAQGMCIYNNDLIVYGGFDSINNVQASDIAKFDGVNWNRMDTMHFGGTGIFTAEEFNGSLYIGGNQVAKNGWCNNLGMYNGTQFVNVDNNIMAGGMNAVMQIVKYKGALYMTGGFNKASGNPANRFVKWDGIKWDTLGGGFTGTAAIASMTVFKNELYCVGSFDNVAGIYSPHMFKFDGSTIYGGNVCNLNSSIFWTAVHGYKDTLYIAGGFEKICNDSAKYIAKWLGNSASFTNSVSVVGVNEINKKENQIKVYPNPVSNTLYISSEQYFEKGTEIEVTNCLGQIVLKLPYRNEVDVSAIANGCYILSIVTSDKQQYHSKFIKE